MRVDDDLDVRVIAQKYLINAEEAAAAYLEGRQLPSLLLKSGLTVHHRPEDPVPLLLFEIFHRAAYTGGGFYSPMPNETVIDCGANIGIFTLYMLSLQPKLTIYCFEPSASTRAKLQHNIGVNCLTANVTIYPHALYSCETSIYLHSPWSSGGKSLFPSSDVFDDQPEEEVTCVSLPAALDLCGESEVALLKVDVEGAELEILEGASNLDWNRIKRIAVEYHDYIRPNCRTEVMTKLKAFGFTSIEINDESQGMGIIRACRL